MGGALSRRRTCLLRQAFFHLAVDLLRLAHQPPRASRETLRLAEQLPGAAQPAVEFVEFPVAPRFGFVLPHQAPPFGCWGVHSGVARTSRTRSSRVLPARSQSRTSPWAGRSG